jgi:replicative DNA helicase
MTKINDRPLPYSAEAEQSVLGALMQDAGVFDAVGTMLRPADFHDAAHRAIYEAMQREISGRRPVDSVSLFVALQAAGCVDRVGGLSYLAALETCVATPRSAKRHAEIVRERAQHRALLAAADEAMELAAGRGSVAEKVERIAALFGVLQRQQVAKLPRSILDIAIERTQHYEDLLEGRVEAGWQTRIPTLDAMLSGGLRPGGLYIIAARPKVGKSSLAQSVALTMAKAGRPTLFLSQEMADTEIADRAVSSAGRLDYARLLSGKMGGDDWTRASNALEDLKDAALFVDDQGGLTLLDIKAKARTVPGLKVLVLDYLQLCSSGLSDSNRNAQIEELSRGLKTMAKQMGVAVIALSQLNRDVEKRASKRPQLSDLRDSGAIEQDADAVLFLWPVREAGIDGHKLVGLAVEANRQGRCGVVGLNFHGSTQRWGESTESVDQQTMQQGKKGGYE